MAALLFLIGLASNWSSAPTSQFMLRMQEVALFGSIALLLLGAIAIAVPRMRIASAIIAVATLAGYIFLISL